jgi:1,2-diacylglycerol 3-alpha-glucosyltransferase
MTNNTQALRILFVTNNYTPYSGGVVSSINAMVPELHKRGHQVFIVTLDFLGAQHHHHDPAYVYRISCPIKFSYRGNTMAIPWRMKQQLQKLINDLKPDIIHSHHPWLLGSSALHVARAHNIPIVFTFHTLYEQYAYYVPMPLGISRPIINYVVKKYCAAADGLIAPSHAVQQQLTDWKITTPTLLLPSPVAPIFAQKSGLATVNTPRNRFILLSVGRLVPEKNIPFLLDMFAQLHRERPHDVVFNIVGYGAREEALKKYAYQQLALPYDSVQFLGKKNGIALRQAYQHADIFLFSSLSDTQGLVLAEAMSCGLPVVALDGPGQRDNITQGVDGFLVSSISEMLHAIKCIIDNPLLHTQLRKNAQIKAEHYYPTSIISRLQRWYYKFAKM